MRSTCDRRRGEAAVRAPRLDRAGELGTGGGEIATPGVDHRAPGDELVQVVVVAQLGGERDRLVERGRRRVVLAREVLQLAEGVQHHAEAEPLTQRREGRVGGAQELALAREIAVVLRAEGPGLQRDRPGPRVVGRLGQLAQRTLVLLGERDGDRLHQLQRRVPGPRQRGERGDGGDGADAAAQPVAGADGHHRLVGQGERADVRVDVVVRRRQRREPPLALLEPAADQPRRPRHRDDDPVRDRDVRRGAAPQRQVDLVGLGAQPRQPAQLVAAADVRLGLLHEVEDERGVRGLGGRAFARRVELLARVGPDRLQHAVAGGAVGLRHGDDERLVDQRGERIHASGPHTRSAAARVAPPANAPSRRATVRSVSVSRSQLQSPKFCHAAEAIKCASTIKI